MTRQDNISAPFYPETKKIIDALMPDEIFESHELRISGTQFTWLEMLRTVFAIAISTKYKKQYTQEKIEEMLSLSDVQDWLDWIWQTMNGGAQTGNMTVNTPFSRYSQSPGLAFIKWMTVTEYGQEIYGSGLKSIYIDKIRGIFSDTPNQIHDEAKRAIEKDIQDAQKITRDYLERRALTKIYAYKWHEGTFPDHIYGRETRDLIVDMLGGDYEAKTLLSLDNGQEIEEMMKSLSTSYDPSSLAYTIQTEGVRVLQGRANVRLTTPNGTEIDVSVNPFGFDPGQDRKQLCEAMILSEYIEPLARQIEEDLANTQWGQEEELKASFIITISSMNFRYQFTAPEPPKITITPRIRCKQITGTLIEKDYAIGSSGISFSIGSEENVDDIYKHVRSSQFSKSLQTPQDKLLESIEKEYKKKKGRQKKIAKLGEATIELDKVAAWMLEIARKADPKAVDELLSRKTNSVIVKIPKDMLAGFCGTPKKTVKVTFSMTEGLMLTKFDLKPGLTWDKRRLIVPLIPDTLKTGLKGMPARDVVEHPISDMLGPVKRITDMKWRNMSAISFELDKQKMNLNSR